MRQPFSRWIHIDPLLWIRRGEFWSASLPFSLSLLLSFFFSHPHNFPACQSHRPPVPPTLCCCFTPAWLATQWSTVGCRWCCMGGCPWPSRARWTVKAYCRDIFSRGGGAGGDTVHKWQHSKLLYVGSFIWVKRSSQLRASLSFPSCCAANPQLGRLVQGKRRGGRGTPGNLHLTKAIARRQNQQTCRAASACRLLSERQKAWNSDLNIKQNTNQKKSTHYKTYLAGGHRPVNSSNDTDCDRLCVDCTHDSSGLQQSVFFLCEACKVKLLSAEQSSEWLACYFERAARQRLRQQGHK